jgi:hypothetical protein
MKHKLRMFAIHQTVTSLQQINNLNPIIRWYPALDESNRMKSTYFTIHPGKNPPPQNGCRLNFFLKHRFHILHFPNSTGLFTKPTGHHYTKYQFSADIGLHHFWSGICVSFGSFSLAPTSHGIWNTWLVWDRSPISFKHMFFLVYVLGANLTMNHLNRGVW